MREVLGVRHKRSGLMEPIEMEVEEDELDKDLEQRLILRAPRDLMCYAARIVHLPFSRVWAHGWPQSQQLGIMIVEEPSSQERGIGDDEIVYSNEDEESKHDPVDFEREAENLLNKRKAEVETEAEKRARKTHEAYAAQGVSLTEVIDEVAADHAEIHEKASTLKLQLDAYKTRIMDTSSSAQQFQETEFLYEEDLQEGKKRGLEATKEVEGQEPQPSPPSSKARRLRKFVSPKKY